MENGPKLWLSCPRCSNVLKSRIRWKIRRELAHPSSRRTKHWQQQEKERERECKGECDDGVQKKKGSMRIHFGVVSSTNNKIQWTGVMAQLTERSFLMPEDPGSNPVMCNFLKKIGHSRPFFFIFFFWTQLAINKCSIKVCRWLDLNHGSRYWKQQLYQLSPTTTAHVQLLFTINCLKKRRKWRKKRL